MIGEKICDRCIYIRPTKNNKCIISGQHIVDTSTYFCQHFKVDIVIQRREEDAAEKKDDDGSKRKSSYRYSRPNFVFKKSEMNFYCN
jgi:hypothetical protein